MVECDLLSSGAFDGDYGADGQNDSLGKKEVKPISVAAFTRGVDAPSARFRIHQLQRHLSGLDIHLHPYPSKVSNFQGLPNWQLPIAVLNAVVSRAIDVAISNKFDVAVFQRELVSSLFTFERFVTRPRILDVDDALFLRKRGGNIFRVAEVSDHVICGNEFLAENFSKYSKALTVIPTGVDIERYVPRGNAVSAPRKVVGWIGTSSNFAYLYMIEDALSKVFQAERSARFRVVADARPKFSPNLDRFLDFIPWTAQSEVQEIQRFDVGIMPLADGLWERGKCSYKMLQYMACGVPVVVSPIGMNLTVLSKGDCGLAAGSSGEWVEAILSLLRNPESAKNLGVSGRRIVKDHYSSATTAASLGSIIRTLA